jgi:DNA-binding NarL/FixJ family response regulator
VSEATVKTHLHNVYGKLKLDGRVALTVFAREKGLV